MEGVIVGRLQIRILTIPFLWPGVQDSKVDHDLWVRGIVLTHPLSIRVTLTSHVHLWGCVSKCVQLHCGRAWAVWFHDRSELVAGNLANWGKINTVVICHPFGGGLIAPQSETNLSNTESPTPTCFDLQPIEPLKSGPHWFTDNWWSIASKPYLLYRDLYLNSWRISLQEICNLTMPIYFYLHVLPIWLLAKSLSLANSY